jgi:hypothetical protein
MIQIQCQNIVLVAQLGTSALPNDHAKGQSRAKVFKYRNVTGNVLPGNPLFFSISRDMALTFISSNKQQF